MCRGGPGGGKPSSPGAACSTMAMALRGSSFPRPPPQGARYNKDDQGHRGTWFKVCSGPIYHGLSTPDDRCVGRHGTPSTRTHRPASAGAAGGHHKAPGWGGLSSQPKKAHICRQSSSFARRQLSRGPPRRGCRTAEVRLPRSSVTAGLRALAPPPKPSTASGRASAVQRSVLNSAVRASLE